MPVLKYNADQHRYTIDLSIKLERDKRLAACLRQSSVYHCVSRFQLTVVDKEMHSQQTLPQTKQVFLH